MIEYRVNLAAVQTFDDIIAAFNTGFIDSLGENVDWNGNLDAFNDYFYWPQPQPYAMVLLGWDRCEAVLQPLSTWNGLSMLAAFKEIFAANPQAIISFA